MKSLVGDNSSIILILLSTVGYILFVDVIRAYVDSAGIGTADKIVLIGIVLVVLLIGLNHEGDGE